MENKIDKDLINLYLTHQNLMEFLKEHMLLGWAWSKKDIIRKYARERVNEVDWDVAHKQYLYQLHRNQLYLEQLNEIQKMAKDKGISSLVVLKGAALLNRIYLDFGERWMSDIDLLVMNDEDAYQLDKLLNRLGFTLFQEPKWFGNDFKTVWHKTKEGIEITIEVHRKLFYHLRDTQIPYEFCMKREFDEQQIFSKEFELVYLLGHCIFQHNLLKFYWLLDCLSLYFHSRDDLDLDKVEAIAKEMGLKKSLEVFKYIVLNYFNDDKFVHLARNVNVKTLAKLITKDFLVTGRQGGAHYHLVKNYVKDSILTSIKYNFHWLRFHFF